MLAHSHCTVEEYLAFERDADDRHLYLDGYIFDAARESPEHGTICMNLSRVVSTQLLDTPCRAFAKDTKVGSGPGRLGAAKGLFSYPDLVVVCGEMRFQDERRDVLTNPVVIIEVLSPSTEAFDRGEKFHRFQTWNPTLTDYLLVSQTHPIIEHFIRQSDGSWAYHKREGLERVVSITSINCTPRLSEVFDRIEFPALA